MTKGQKRPPLPVLALTEKDRAHLNWIRQNSTNFVRTALKLYYKSGRSAGAYCSVHRLFQLDGQTVPLDLYRLAVSRLNPIEFSADGTMSSLVQSRFTAVLHRAARMKQQVNRI
jgi:hypothetical protein